MKRFIVLFLCACILMQSFLCTGLLNTVSADGGGIIPLSFEVTDSVINPDKPVIYFSDMANKKLYEVNYETGDNREITFKYPPERIAYSNGKIYVCLLKGEHSSFWLQEDQQGAFAVIDADNFTKISECDISLDPYDIAADTYGNVYISSGSGQWPGIRSYTEQGHQIYANYETVHERSKIFINPDYNRVYGVSMAYNTFIETHDIDSSGNISKEIWKGSFSMNDAKSASMSPDGKYLFVDFNRSTEIFSCNRQYAEDVVLVGSILKGSRGMAYDLENNRFFMCDGTNQVGIYEYDFMEKTGTVNAANNVEEIYYKNYEFIAVTSNSSKQFAIEVIPSSSIVQTPAVGNPDPYSVKLRGTIKDTIYDGNKAYSIDNAFNHLFITDLNTRQVIKQVKLPYRPSGLCISEDKTRIFVANSDTNYPVTELDINTGNVRRNLKYAMEADYVSSNGSVLSKHIYNRGGKLYLVGGEWEHKLYVFEASSFEFISSPLKNIGGMVFSPNNDYFYYRDTLADYLQKYSIDGTTFTQVATSNFCCFDTWVSPFDTLPLLLNGKDEIICKKYIFSQDDLSLLERFFPEDIYAVNTDANLALGPSGFYNLSTCQEIEYLDLEGAKSFYLDQDLSLIYEKNNILKIPKLLSVDTNATRVSLDKNQTFQVFATGGYSDGRKSDLTSQATFKTGNPNIATASSTGLVTGVGMGTTEIVINYGSFTQIIKVDVALGLKSITLSSGELSPNFDPRVTSYDVILPFRTEKVPVLTAIAQDPNAKVSIEPAASLPGSTEIILSSPDGSYSIKYIVHFEVAQYIESNHPYATNTDVLWEYTEPDYTGDLMKITFSSDTALESSCDYLYISDKYGDISGSPFTGNNLAGKTITVKGNSFKIRLTSDNGTNLYGFRITSIEYAKMELTGITTNTDDITFDGQEPFQLKVDADYSDGSKIDVTNEVIYSSENHSIAKVDQYGLITAVACGSTSITTLYKGYITTVKVNVIDARPKDVIYPDNLLIRQISKNSISIIWTNKNPYVCMLEYGTEENTGFKTGWSLPSQEHKFILDGLEPASHYNLTIHYMINGEEVKSDLIGIDTTDCSYFDTGDRFDRVIYDSINNKAYGFSKEKKVLSIIDLSCFGLEKTIGLEEIPSDLCLSDDKKTLYILNSNGSVHVFDTVSKEKVEEIKFSIPNTYGRSTHFHIYYKNKKLFMVDGAWAPGLWVYDPESRELKNYTSKINGIGDLVFSSSGNEFYYWYQYGWDSGWGGSNIYKCSIDESGNISIVKKLYEQNSGHADIGRDPLNTPIFLDESQNRMYCKNIVLDVDNFKIINKLSENIYDFGPENKNFAGTTQLFRTSDLSVSSTMPRADSQNVFFDKTGTLYMCQPNDTKVFYYNEDDIEVVGDYNGDKKVNSIDFAVLKKYLLGMVVSFEAKDKMYVGDLNRDGSINSIDFAILKGYLLGVFNKLPYET